MIYKLFWPVVGRCGDAPMPQRGGPGLPEIRRRELRGRSAGICWKAVLIASGGREEEF
jgi:hypothetical protein